MRVLVTGGTGFIGGYLCRELAENGHEVTALARDPDPDSLPDGVEAAVGDVTAYDSIEPAFEGQDAVVNLVALSPLFKPSGGDEMHFRVHRDGTENVVRAAEEQGVDRILQMSALDADPDAPTANLQAKGEAETIVRESSLDHTIVRPSVVFGEGDEFVRFTALLTPPLLAPLPGGGTNRFQPIWIGDLAPILAAAVTEDEHAGETYEFGGPEVLSLGEISRMVRHSRGHPVLVVPLPMPVAKLGLTVLDKVPGSPFGLDQYRALSVDNVVEENDVTVFGVDPDDLRSLGDYLGVDD